MYHGDRSRKEVLVAYGFRLPSALDNRPLNFEEWEARVSQVVFVSATPGPYELAKARRRRGRADHPADRPDRSADRGPAGARARSTTCSPRFATGSARRERVLVTTLTKRMAEDLTQYYQELGVRVRYLHSDIDTLERIEILRDLRRGEFDVLVGINLLREGLDLPEVSLVAILDADKEGFLRSGGVADPDLGRAARNVERPGDHVRGQDDRLDASWRSARPTGAGRSRRPTTREHGITPALDRQAHRRGDVERLRARLRDGPGGGRDGSERFTSQAELDARGRRPAGADEGGRRQPRVREGGRAARPRSSSCATRELGLAGPGAPLIGAASSNSWLKAALLEVQEYVRAGRRRRCRGVWSRGRSTSATSSSSSRRSASAR